MIEAKEPQTHLQVSQKVITSKRKRLSAGSEHYELPPKKLCLHSEVTEAEREIKFIAAVNAFAPQLPRVKKTEDAYSPQLHTIKQMHKERLKDLPSETVVRRHQKVIPSKKKRLSAGSEHYELPPRYLRSTVAKGKKERGCLLSTTTHDKTERGCLLSTTTHDKADLEMHQELLKDDIYVKYLGEPSERILSDIKCSKNHDKFIAYTKQNKQHILNSLPINYQHEEMVDLIYSLADLTVKVEVRWEPGLTENKETIETYDTLIASGKIVDSDIIVCDESEAASSAEQSAKGEISFLTSAKIINRAKSPQHITCVLFYDDINSQVIKLTGFEMEVVADTCFVTCKTSDTKLVNKLKKLIKHHNTCWLKAFNKYIKVKSSEDKLAILVSHPHDCPKHISIGKWDRGFIRVESRKMLRYIYDLPTCPGSNGAYVMIPNFDDEGDLPFNFRNDQIS